MGAVVKLATALGLFSAVVGFVRAQTDSEAEERMPVLECSLIDGDQMSPSDMYYKLVADGATPLEAAEALRRAIASKRLAHGDSPAGTYWATRELGGTEGEAATAMVAAAVAKSADGSPAGAYWRVRSQGGTEVEATEEMRRIAQSSLPIDASPSAVYWLLRDQGASQAAATNAMRETSRAQSLKNPESPADSYWLAREGGASEEEATEIMRRTALLQQLQGHPNTAAGSLYAEMKCSGMTDDEILVEMELLPEELTSMLLGYCEVYPAKIYWCAGGVRRSRNAHLSSLCWDEWQEEIELCSLVAPRPQGESRLYYFTAVGDCINDLPATDTCVAIVVEDNAVNIDCELYEVITCDCIVEDDCSEVETECKTIGTHPGCPECEE